MRGVGGVAYVSTVLAQNLQLHDDTQSVYL
jgi:hypothetical protein